MAERMKPSGISWIGDIPASWKRSKVKFCFSLVNGSTPESSDYDCWDGDIKWITPADMSDTGIISHGERLITKYGYNSCGTTLLPIGSIVISSRAPIGKINITTAELCTNQGCKSLIRTGDNRYFYYLFLAGQHELSLLGRGTTFLELSTYDLNGFGLVIPAEDEQKAIADFLDKECAQIDSIAADLEKQIELLQKYKKSLITETVIKGLDKSVPMKDSGADWIPYEIPEQWELSKIKYIFNLRDEKNYQPLEEVNLISLYTDLGVVQHCDLETTTGNKAYTADGYKKVYVDDIVVNIILCWMGAIGISQYEGVTSPAYDVYYAIDKAVICPQYYHYLFKIEQFHGKCYSVGRGIMAMRWRTYSSEFRNITVPVPPMQEQCEIAEFLDKKCSIIDQIILQKEKQLKSIQQHKKSLIYEYVTGKKRVKEVQ